ncbi:Exportin-T [Wickerhamomyces ciferrii]|uniref:Exportin-T n=1 Tax=Wickerhamomyces ciferrii (strain ATCC 14091 / BCRC 22168 / CBS 111 / JCM 3599 / NBRC 0793 / NRRL Y-1031 F-60-10) TaxID=1206466 RepID=K0KDI8_WICCF|nr:Exportin-T [Wickerhamomyces ciferrii]CCH40991.1 Exportin-T [Wickerhamomyces ciferrii]
MEEQIKQAVQIAITGTSDYNLKEQAINFLNELKSSPDGWQAFSLLLKDVTYPDQARFIALQALNDYIPSLSQEQNGYIRSTLLEYLSSIISNHKYDNAYLKNKLAESFASLFCTTYLQSWTNFFKDFEKLISSEDEIAIDQYLRVLLAIHSEIGDQLIVRERPLVERNNALKDSIRINDMDNLTKIWKKLLIDFKDNQSNLSQEISKQDLQVIGGYVSWIEIGLIVEPDYINLILQFLSKNSLKATCCETLVEIISKKMKPENKLQLLSLLNLTGVVSSLSVDGSDLDFVECVAKLYNAIGLELTFILDSSEASSEIKGSADQQIINLFPFILNFLENDYDEVSLQVFSFISNFLAALKKIIKQNNGNIDSTHLNLLSTLLQKIIIKMKYDDSDDGEDEDDISEFNEFRARLKVFQDTIAIINPDLYIDQTTALIEQSIFADTNTNNLDWRTVELGLFELTNLSDSLRNNILGIPKLAIQESKPYIVFQQYLLRTINSNVVSINHPLIQLLFFELIVRHYNYFNAATDKDALTNHILELFISVGLYNSNEKVQIRCWYLFFRFVKLTKPRLNDEIITRLITDLSQKLLIVEAELPQKDDDSELVENSSKFDNQLYLFETLGLLISLVDNSKIELKIKLLDAILNPIFNGLEKTVSEQNKNQLVVLQAHHLLMVIGTIARGFEYDSTPNKTYLPEVVQRFNNTSEVVLVTLENMNSFEVVRDAARFSFARFIPILKSDISSHLSRLISTLLSSQNLKFSEMTDFIGFIGHIIHTFNKDDSIYNLLNDLFTPLTNKVLSMLDNKGENGEFEIMPDVSREKSSLKKAFILLLINLTQNNVSSVLVTQTNKSILPIILQRLLSEANDLNDLQVSKLSLSSLSIFANIFGNDTVNDPKDKYNTGIAIEGISSFLLENLIKSSFQIPFQSAKFDIKDAQYRFVADEIANILKALFNVKNQELITYLREVYFPQIQLPSNVGDDLIQNLINLDIKDFRKYFVNFIQQFK